ncbi:MAG TPA: glycosyltransferase family 2 protein [Candidatus Omnitrophota bacterium]|nr:glycosyltransferase family 2 protein [Candidatus Omnitrophota bacterium]
MYLSIVIPAYNEEKRIGMTLDRIREYVDGKTYGYEIIVVDDGSVDGTVDVVCKSKLFKTGKIKIVRNIQNLGKGFSVRAGVRESVGEYVLFTDADLSTPISEIDKLFSAMNNGTDIIIGSRNTAGSMVNLRQPWYREIMGKTFNVFVKKIMLLAFNDTQCGFKLFRGNTVRKIAEMAVINGFCFDVEFLYIASILGYEIREIGVAWENSAESRVKILSSPVSMFADLIRLRMRKEKLKYVK